MTAPLLSVSRLSVHDGGIRAVRSVSLRVEAGEAVAGLERPAAGVVELDGRDVTGARAERLVRAGIALVTEGRGVFADLPVRDNLILGAYHRRTARGPRRRPHAVPDPRRPRASAGGHPVRR